MSISTEESDDHDNILFPFFFTEVQPTVKDIKVMGGMTVENNLLIFRKIYAKLALEQIVRFSAFT